MLLSILRYRHSTVILSISTVIFLFLLFFASPIYRQLKNAVLYPRIQEGQSFRFATNADFEFDGKYAKYLIVLGFNEEPIDIRNGLPYFTIVTALSEDHADEGRYLVVNISKAFPGRKVVVFGMSISEENQKWFENACNVDFRVANFFRYPPHVAKTKNYAFKPILIAEALKEFGAVLWTDTSSVFKAEKTTKDLLKRIERLDLGEDDPLIFLMIDAYHSTGAATHPALYRYLPLKKELAFSQRQFGSGLQLIYRTSATMHSVYKWCVLCALEKNCAIPPGSHMECNSIRLNKGEYANCHRYDQSILNIAMEPYKSNFLNSSISDGFMRTERKNRLNTSAIVTCN